MANDNEAVDQARQYYDSDDADNFYYRLWGGEDLHIGWYESPDESIYDASQRTVDRILAHLGERPGARVLDIGAGYGGSARHMAQTRDWTVDCLNLSVVQNERNREKNREQGFDGRISVTDGNFEDLPYEDDSFDIVWCQDSMLHSSARKQIFEEVDRVLKPGGEFIFTEPMQKEGVDRTLLEPVLARIHLPSLGSVEAFEQYARELGWETVGMEVKTEHLINHYDRVRRELESREDEMRQHISQAYIDRMKTGLQHWVDAGKNGALVWGILHFRKK